MRVILGPGAFGDAASMARHVAGLRARGVAAEAVELPRGRAERAVLVFGELVAPDVVIGGHSFGGRAASLAAAGPGVEVAGLLCFGFPLSGQAEERTAHFRRVRCPALLISGDRDELSPMEQLQERAALLPRGRLVALPGAGHDLAGALDAALDIAADFVRNLEA